MISIIICEFSFNRVLEYSNLALMKMILRLRPRQRLITAEATDWRAHQRLPGPGWDALWLAFVCWGRSCTPWLRAPSQPRSLGWKEIICLVGFLKSTMTLSQSLRTDQKASTVPGESARSLLTYQLLDNLTFTSSLFPPLLSVRSKTLFLSNYRRFQIMRFAVAEINNSTKLLPNVRLGYELFDHCSDTQCFPGILKLLSVDNVIQPWNAAGKNASKVVAVVGLFTSTFTLTVAPLFMMDFIPMVPVSPVSSTSNCHFLLKSCCCL